MPHGPGIVRRPRLFVLRYDPSVLVEVGFLDSDEDFALLVDDLFKVAAMESVAGAVAAILSESSDRPTGLPGQASRPVSTEAHT